MAPEFTVDLIKSFNLALPQAHIKLQPASGGLLVVSAVDGGRGQLGLAQSDVAYFAYRRGIEHNVYPHRNLRAIAVLWVNSFYALVRRDSAIQSIYELKGRRVGIIPPGTSGEFSARIILGAHGMTYANVQPTFDSMDRLVRELGAGEIDAVLSAYPLLVTGTGLLGDSPLRVLPIDRAVISRLRGSYPFLKAVTVPANEATGQSRPTETLGAEWLFVCRSDLSEELVYHLTRAFFDRLPALAREHGEAALIDPDQAAATPIPLHPGAARYYREREILR